MKWTVHGERTLYDSAWIRLALTDVEVPGGDRFEQHVVRLPTHAAGVVVHDPERGVLLLWRHRFVTDTWGYEIPAGRVDEGETPIEAAAREVLEETGWAPGSLTPIVSYHPSAGLMDQTFDLFLADGAREEGPPSDPSESERVEWVTLDEVRRAVAAGEVTDGMSLTGLLWLLAVGAS